MYTLYCFHSPLRDRLRTLLESRVDLRVCTDWLEFERIAPRANCAVVELDRLSDRWGFDRLLAFQNREATPLVLVTRGELGNARRLKRLSVEEVVWLEDVGEELLPAIRRAEVKDLLVHLRHELDGRNDLSRELRLALSYALDDPNPVRTQKELAVAAGCSRSTLIRHWEATIPGHITLKTFLDWVLLARALSIKKATSSWRKVSEALGIPRETLSQVSRRLTGSPLGELDLEDIDAILRPFRKTIIEPLES